MIKQPVYIVDVLAEVVTATNTVLHTDAASWLSINGKDINYEYGRSIQILNELQNLDKSISLKSKKYPLIAVLQDFPEKRGVEYYTQVTFPKIIIAMLTTSTDNPMKRYDNVFKPVLYPIYYEFMRQLARHKSIIGNDPDAISHTKWDRPGTQPAGTNFNDYLDAIEITDMQLTFKQFSS